MAKRCELCGKGPVVGRQHSHANNVSARRFEPNLQSVKAIVDGGHKRIRVCTRCRPRPAPRMPRTQAGGAEVVPFHAAEISPDTGEWNDRRQCSRPYIGATPVYA